MISEDLKFHKHVDKISDRCNKEINRIRRSFTTRTPTFLAEMYKLYVRPHIEYCVEMWNPGYQGDIKKLELVQNKMTRLLNLGNHMRPEERNTMMGLSTHENRRRRGDLIATFKNIDNPNLFERRASSRTRGNDKTLMMPIARTLVRSHSLSCRIIAEWNALPNDVVNSENVNLFKSNLDKHYLNQTR